MATTPRKAQPRNKMRGAAAKVDTELAEKVTELFPDKETRPTHGTMENKDRAKLLQWIIERVAGPAPKEPPKEQEDSFDVFVRGIVTVGKEDADVPDRYAGRRRKLDEIEDKEW
jgi:hypothetical protein